MNRLATPTFSKPKWQSFVPTVPGSARTALADVPQRPGGHAPLSTFLPVNYEEAYAYPLLIWLHERGGSERHLPQVMQHISTQNYLALAPRAPQADDHRGCGFRWVQDPEGIADAEDAVEEALDWANDRYHFHPDRVFLVGHGEGGSMALRLGLQSPERYAGAASLSGPLPRTCRPLRRLNRVRSLPLLVASSRGCPRCPETVVCGDLKLLHAAGCSLSVRQYPGNDDLTTSMLEDVNRWMMDRVCGA